MEAVHTCPEVRCWSEVLCYTIQSHINDLEVKIRDLEKKICKSFWLKFCEVKHTSGELCCLAAALILIT